MFAALLLGILCLAPTSNVPNPITIGKLTNALNANNQPINNIGGGNLPIILSSGSTPITVLTAGTPADIATIAIPAGITRYRLLQSSATFTAFANAASGSLGNAGFVLRDAAAGAGNVLSPSAAALNGPTAVNLISGTASVSATATYTAATLYIRQTANSNNAGTVTFYVIVVPIY
jgi:hypothetical protein